MTLYPSSIANKTTKVCIFVPAPLNVVIRHCELRSGHTHGHFCVDELDLSPGGDHRRL
jgi:hypothetical protein